MSGPEGLPPGLLPWVLRACRRLLPPEVRDEIPRDLAADFDKRRQQGDGVVGAGARLVWDVLTTDYPGLHRAARRVRHLRGAVGGRQQRRTSWLGPSGGPHGDLGRGGAAMGGGAAAWRFGAWHAWRVLVRAKGFATLAVVTIGAGVGSVAAVGGLVSSVLLRPLPYADAGRLVMVWQADLEQGDLRINASAPQFVQWDETVRSFSASAAYRGPGYTLVTDGPQPERVVSVRVTTDFFELLGVAPILGRGFAPGDAVAEGRPAVIVSHALWERLGRTAEGLGTAVSLDEEPHVIVGVMPPGFAFVERDVDVWYAWAPPPSAGWDEWTLKVVARLAPGIDPGEAEAEVAARHAALRAAEPGLDVPPAVVVRPLLDEIVGDVRTGLVASAAAVGLGLLLAAVNLGGLLLARNVARRHELAMMRALGAGRRTVFAHIVAQSLVLATAGLVAGLLLGQGLVALARAVLPADFPRIAELSLDGFALTAAAVAALVVAVGAGALSLPWRDAGLGGSLRDARGSRTLGGILVGQTALSVVLLVAGGLLVRSFLDLAAVDPGIDPDGVLALELRLPGSLAGDDQGVRRFVAEVDEAVAALPGVAAVGQIQRLPFAGGNWSSFVLDPERPGTEPLEGIDVRVVTPGYLAAIGLPLLRGRGFGAQDGPAEGPVVLVNERLARELWPGSDPLGRAVAVDMFDARPREVVGVVGPVRHHGLDAESRPEVYLPWAQMPVAFSSLVVRGTLGPELTAAVRRAVHDVQPAATVSRATLVRDLVTGSIATERMHAFVFGALALMALGLAGVGTFGLASFRVARERREAGVRAALGASAGHLRKRVLVGTGRLLLTGLALGFLGALLALRGLSALLHGLAPTDPATFAVVAGVLTVLGLAAASVPAARAARADPMVALRENA